MRKNSKKFAYVFVIQLFDVFGMKAGVRKTRPKYIYSSDLESAKKELKVDHPNRTIEVKEV